MHLAARRAMSRYFFRASRAISRRPWHLRSPQGAFQPQGRSQNAQNWEKKLKNPKISKCVNSKFDLKFQLKHLLLDPIFKNSTIYFIQTAKFGPKAKISRNFYSTRPRNVYFARNNKEFIRFFSFELGELGDKSLELGELRELGDTWLRPCLESTLLRLFRGV